MHNLQMALKEIVSHKNLHLNVVPLEAQLRASCNNWMKLLHGGTFHLNCYLPSNLDDSTAYF